MQDRILQLGDPLPDPVAAEVEVAAHVAGSGGAAVDASTTGSAGTAGEGLQQAGAAASQPHMAGPQCFHAYNPSTLEDYQQVSMLHGPHAKVCSAASWRPAGPHRLQVPPPVTFQQRVDCLALCDVKKHLEWLAMEALLP